MNPDLTRDWKPVQVPPRRSDGKFRSSKFEPRFAPKRRKKFARPKIDR